MPGIGEPHSAGPQFLPPLQQLYLHQQCQPDAFLFNTARAHHTEHAQHLAGPFVRSQDATCAQSQPQHSMPQHSMPQEMPLRGIAGGCCAEYGTGPSRVAGSNESNAGPLSTEAQLDDILGAFRGLHKQCLPHGVVAFQFWCCIYVAVNINQKMLTVHAEVRIQLFI